MTANDPNQTQSGDQRTSVSLIEAPPRVYLSLIVPAFNEERRLPATLERLREFLDEQRYSYEVLVVDDGSRDETTGVVERFSADWGQLRCVRNDRNRGKGYSVRHGVMESKGKDILFSDADLSTPIEESERLLQAITSGEYDIAIGSRGLPESTLEERQPWLREAMGRMANRVIQSLAIPGIQDTQCGFKAFRGEVARTLFQLQRIERFAFDIEVLYLARKFGYRIQEIPVRWINSPDSRVSAIRDYSRSFWDMLRIRMNDIKGLYASTRVSE